MFPTAGLLGLGAICDRGPKWSWTPQLRRPLVGEFRDRAKFLFSVLFGPKRRNYLQNKTLLLSRSKFSSEGEGSSLSL